jgi:phosphatidylglycerol:prolipoprotein diacylglycerol transferase
MVGNLLAIKPTIFKLGGLSIRWYALCIMSGVVLAVWLAMKEAPSKKMTSDDVLDFILLAFPIAIIGARLYYVLFKLTYYVQYPSEIFAIWRGGLAIYGGLIAGVIVLLFFSHYKKINAFDFLDIATPGVLIAQAMGRWGNFFNQEAYGHTVASLKFLPDFIKKQMLIDGAYRLPTFLYESLWNVAGFALVMIFRHRLKWLKSGNIFSFYLFWYGFGRFIIEGMRADSLMLGAFRVSQILSLLLMIGGMILMLVKLRQKQ